MGKNHWNWKGGKKINSQGYILIYSPNHPYKDNQKYVREHRLVMEKKIGRYILPTEIVHHINGKVDDNRIENLQLLLKRIHDSISMKGRIFVEKIKKNCLMCNKKFLVYPSRKNTAKFCSKKCLANYRWKYGKEEFGR